MDSENDVCLSIRVNRGGWSVGEGDIWHDINGIVVWNKEQILSCYKLG